MFGNTVVVNSRTTVRLVQEEGASFKNVEEEINGQEEKVGRGATDPKMFFCYEQTEMITETYSCVRGNRTTQYVCVF